MIVNVVTLKGETISADATEILESGEYILCLKTSFFGTLRIRKNSAIRACEAILEVLRGT